jgi:hypothetical protein
MLQVFWTVYGKKYPDSMYLCGITDNPSLGSLQCQCLKILSELIPLITVLTEKLTVTQLLKKFLSFHYRVHKDPQLGPTLSQIIHLIFIALIYPKYKRKGFTHTNGISQN